MTDQFNPDGFKIEEVSVEQQIPIDEFLENRIYQIYGQHEKGTKMLFEDRVSVGSLIKDLSPKLYQYSDSTDNAPLDLLDYIRQSFLNSRKLVNLDEESLLLVNQILEDTALLIWIDMYPVNIEDKEDVDHYFRRPKVSAKYKENLRKWGLQHLNQADLDLPEEYNEVLTQFNSYAIDKLASTDTDEATQEKMRMVLAEKNDLQRQAFLDDFRRYYQLQREYLTNDLTELDAYFDKLDDSEKEGYLNEKSLGPEDWIDLMSKKRSRIIGNLLKNMLLREIEVSDQSQNYGKTIDFASLFEKVFSRTS